MCFALILGERVLGPANDAHVIKLVDKYGIEIEIPSPTRAIQSSWVLKSRGVNKFVRVAS